MTHRMAYAEQITTDPSTGANTVKHVPVREGSKLRTVCGQMVHRKWVKEDGAVECQCCFPTMSGMLKQIAGLPREIKRVGKALGVAA